MREIRILSLVCLGFISAILSHRDAWAQSCCAVGPRQTSTAVDGKKLPDCALKDAEGREVRLSDFKGRAVVVGFWRAGSDASRKQARYLNELYIRHKEDGIKVVGIVLNSSQVDGEALHALKAFVSESGLAYPVLAGDLEVLERCGIREEVTTFVLDRDGKVTKRYAGMSDANDLEKQTTSLLSSGRRGWRIF